MQARVGAFYKQLEADGIEQRFTHRLDGDLQWRYNQVRVSPVLGPCAYGRKHHLHGSSGKLQGACMSLSHGFAVGAAPA